MGTLLESISMLRVLDLTIISFGGLILNIFEGKNERQSMSCFVE